MDLKPFVRDLLLAHHYADFYDIDSGDFQDLLVKHGLCIERSATEDDCAQEWAQEYEYQVGDDIIVYADEIKALIQQKTGAPAQTERLPH